MSRLLDPPLTAVGWDTPRAASAAADMLAGVIDGEAAADVVIEPQLHVRGSSGPPPRG